MKNILTVILAIMVVAAAVIIYQRVSIIKGGQVVVWSRKDAAERFRRELEDEYASRGNGDDV